MTDLQSLPRPKTIKEAYKTMSRVIEAIKKANLNINWAECARDFKRVSTESLFKNAKTDWGVFPKSIGNVYCKLLREYEQIDSLGSQRKDIDQGLFSK